MGKETPQDSCLSNILVDKSSSVSGIGKVDIFSCGSLSLIDSIDKVGISRK